MRSNSRHAIGQRPADAIVSKHWLGAVTLHSPGRVSASTAPLVQIRRFHLLALGESGNTDDGLERGPQPMHTAVTLIRSEMPLSHRLHPPSPRWPASAGSSTSSCPSKSSSWRPALLENEVQKIHNLVRFATLRPFFAPAANFLSSPAGLNSEGARGNSRPPAVL